MTAAEARETTLKAQKDLTWLLNTIKVMAEGGYNYATVSVRELQDPEGYKSELENLGYKVELTTYFVVKW